MENKKILANGYGIMPNIVLGDNTLTDGARLLYVLISSLCASKGYCWATNSYFAEFFNVSEATISSRITELDKYLCFENRDSHLRKMSLFNDEFNAEKEPSNLFDGSGEPSKNLEGTIKNSLGNPQENLKHNNIRNNKKNTSLNIRHPLQEYIAKELPNVSKMKKQLTYDECENLLGKFDRLKIKSTLEAMENKSDLTKKYLSVNLTLQNWLRRDGNANSGIKQSSTGNINERGKINKSEIERELANAYGREETTELFEG